MIIALVSFACGCAVAVLLCAAGDSECRNFLTGRGFACNLLHQRRRCPELRSAVANTMPTGRTVVHGRRSLHLLLRQPQGLIVPWLRLQDCFGRRLWGFRALAEPVPPFLVSLVSAEAVAAAG
ncbi:hypothetical protein COO60DRAFT_909294 [Scenedesmus sp. NREL 46B-D3]|nr:hypothetical protein COO60DRAFT_909294 [Scenedesmus sp. NREL 46B-D3]